MGLTTPSHIAQRCSGTVAYRYTPQSAEYFGKPLPRPFQMVQIKAIQSRSVRDQVGINKNKDAEKAIDDLLHGCNAQKN